MKLKEILIFAFIFLLTLVYSQSTKKNIALNSLTDIHFFQETKDGYEILTSYKGFLKSFQINGNNQYDSSNILYLKTKRILDDYFSKNDKLNPSLYIDNETKEFFKDRYKDYYWSCLAEGQVSITNKKTSEKLKFIIYKFDYSVISDKNNKKTTESREFLFSGEKESIIGLAHYIESSN